MNEKPTHLDLCSGIGGFSLAFEAAGFQTIGFSEISMYPSAVLKKQWPSVRNFGDLRNISKRAVESCCGGRIGIITAGIPCQPFSLAGLRRGAEDDRHLGPAVLHVIKRLRPSWVCIENVAEFSNVALDETISYLEDIGYACQPFIIPASGAGACHERKRLWLIANATKEPWIHQPKLRKKTQRLPHHSAKQWDSYPWDEARAKLCRVDDGIPNRVYRTESLGNSIFIPIAFQIAKAIRMTL